MDSFQALNRSKLDKAISICQFEFVDKSALFEALLMAGTFAMFVDPALQEGNKRIALIGDHVLALVVRLHSYARGEKIGMCALNVCRRA